MSAEYPAEDADQVDRLKAENVALKTQVQVLESISRQRIVRENADIEAARNWRDLCALIRKARGE